MGQKGKMTKTEIFCLLFTAGFVILCLLLFCRGDRGAQKWQVVTEKDAPAGDMLPQKININTADEEQLQMLPGVGPVLARRIIAWREENGDYVLPEDLLAVEGIGLTKLDEMRDLITIQEEP